MTSVFLSCYNLPVIKQVAQILGWIMNLLYEFFDTFGIQNIGLSILFFTIIVKMILLPMTIKQQKFTKLSAVMNPEIQAVQKKYRDKKDQESMMKMNQEMSSIYEKYGTSPTGGCLTMLIQLPILLALYGVVSQIPTFINDVGEYVDNVGAYVSESVEYFDELDRLDELNGGSAEGNPLDDLSGIFESNSDGIDKEKTGKNIADSFKAIASSPNAIFEQIFGAYTETDEIIDKLAALSDSEWDKLLENNDNSQALIEKYRDADWDKIRKELSESKENVEGVKREVDNAYDFIGINLSQSPSSSGGAWALIIPILAALSQFISIKVSNKFTNSAQMNGQENPMGSSMKMMTYTMPVMSAIFCYSLPAGLGVYWVMSAVVQTVQTVFIGKYFIKLDVNDIIKSNIEKQNKKREKKGLPPKKITTAATANVKNIKSEETKPETNSRKDVKVENGNTASKKSGIAAKANLVSKYNDRK